MPSKAIPSKGKVTKVVVTGMKETSAALILWRTFIDREYKKAAPEAELILKKAIQKILRTGDSRTSSFDKLSFLSSGIQSSGKVRGRRPSGGLPFKGGTGDLAKNIRVTSSIGQVREGQRGVLFKLKADVNPVAKLKANALIHGATIPVGPAVRRFFIAIRMPLAMTTSVLVIPPRDFLAAGAQDASDKLQKLHEQVLERANLKVMLAIPPVMKASAYALTTGSAGRGKVGIRLSPR